MWTWQSDELTALSSIDKLNLTQTSHNPYVSNSNIWMCGLK